MRFSRLQKYILSQCYFSKGAKLKADFYNFYSKKKIERNKKNVQDIIHKSLESLIFNDLLIAFGRKTAQKWFIDRVKLTRQGRKLAREIIKSRQRKLPIK